MASLVSRLWLKLYKKRPVLSVMIVGLDNSGKTSILNNLLSFNQPSSASHESHHQSGLLNKSSSPSSLSSDTRSPTNKDSTRRHRQHRAGGDNVSPTVGYTFERIQHRGFALTALDFSGQNRYRNLWQEFYNCVDAIVFVIDSSDLIRLVVVRDELETLLSHPYFGTLPGDSSTGGSTDRQPLFPQKQIILQQGKLVQSPLDSSSMISSSSGSSSRSENSSSTNNSTSTTSISSSSSSSRGQRVKIPILFLANKSDLANSVDIEVIVRALNLNQLPKSRHPWHILATSVNSNQGIGEGFDWLVSQLSTTSTAPTSTPTPTAAAAAAAPPPPPLPS